MYRHFIALTALVTPLTLGITSAQAQSWKDWVDENPTYNTPATTAPAAVSAPAATSSPAQPQVPIGASPSGSSRSNPTSKTQNPFSTHNPIFADRFLAGCESEGAPPSYCQCALSEIQNSYTFDEFVTIIDFATKNNEIPSEILQVAMKCLPGG